MPLTRTKANVGSARVYRIDHYDERGAKDRARSIYREEMGRAADLVVAQSHFTHFLVVCGVEQ
jgi:hypothetical protein